MVWFGEALDTLVMDRAHRVLRECDLCLLVSKRGERERRGERGLRGERREERRETERGEERKEREGGRERQGGG